ncbi:OLC1v1022346C3 [Oldenlandia corymbosa var. corymbosa]|uniref:Chloride channel protein n=1 Tax=Oldenlandia corymbosa var. corymbosa TaxID=529605 RepID=A0AAV1C095_OLDCO|nr:OLC1v1022346C3 [Oldenlandia corymbosa var. corymbosa]
MSAGEFSDQNALLRSNSSASSEDDIEAQSTSSTLTPRSTARKKGIRDLLNRLDRGFNRRNASFNRRPSDSSSSATAGHPHNHSLPSPSYSDNNTVGYTHGNTRNNGNAGSANGSVHASGDDEMLGDFAPPEWALLLIGCLLGLATGLCVAAFNRGVHVIHEWAWAGTPNEGAAWLRLQRLADTWHRILLIPVLGGVIVGMLHGLLDILSQIQQSSSSSQGQGLDVIAGIFPTVKALQAAITLGTGGSLGPEGPSVDIGKSCAYGCSVMMENNKERRIALVAAGAAAGISSGFNAPVAGCFFAIETVLRPLRAENSPPFTTAMIILASVISSTVSNAVLGEKQAFTVPTYELKSAAELPLYLILGMLCGVVSVAFTHLVAWFGKAFQFTKERFGINDVVCPAIGGLGAGIIALRYPGILYWGFTNVDEILHTGKTASAPGIWLLAQLAAAKVVATTLCKGSGLVGGLYAPSLMIGAAVGAVFGGLSGELINSAIPGNAAVAQPQAYALVGMAATLASVCSVPLTSILLLFELTKDYRILLPLMGAVGLAIWVPSVTNESKETDASDSKSLTRGYSVLSPLEDKNEEERNGMELSIVGSRSNEDEVDELFILEELKVSDAMSKNFLRVRPTQTIKEALNSMHDSHQSCVLVVDAEDCLEGILTYGDIKRYLFKQSGDTSNTNPSLSDVSMCPVSAVCTRGIIYRGRHSGLLTCYPDSDMATAKQLLEARGIKQLPVIKRAGGDLQKERKRRVVAVLYYDSIQKTLRDEMDHRKLAVQPGKENSQ